MELGAVSPPAAVCTLRVAWGAMGSCLERPVEDATGRNQACECLGSERSPGLASVLQDASGGVKKRCSSRGLVTTRELYDRTSSKTHFVNRIIDVRARESSATKQKAETLRPRKNALPVSGSVETGYMRAAGIRACVLALAVSVCALPDVGGPPRRETERLKDKGALERRASGEAERADEERRLADCDGYRTVDLPDAQFGFCPLTASFAVSLARSGSKDSAHTRTVAISMKDGNTQDTFAVKISQDAIYGTPIFTTMGGRSSWCRSTQRRRRGRRDPPLP